MKHYKAEICLPEEENFSNSELPYNVREVIVGRYLAGPFWYIAHKGLHWKIICSIQISIQRETYYIYYISNHKRVGSMHVFINILSW